MTFALNRTRGLVPCLPCEQAVWWPNVAVCHANRWFGGQTGLFAMRTEGLVAEPGCSLTEPEVWCPCRQTWLFAMRTGSLVAEHGCLPCEQGPNMAVCNANRRFRGRTWLFAIRTGGWSPNPAVRLQNVKFGALVSKPGCLLCEQAVWKPWAVAVL